MFQSVDIWKAFAGIAIFLLGVRFMEDALHNLAGRSFKLFLKTQTRNKIKAIGSGTLTTAVLQSSSAVSLMVLAFVGTGILGMQNAIAIILGANLGTTITGWLVALGGFEFEIGAFAYPIAAIAGLTYFISTGKEKLSNWSGFLFGFSFLFIGLGYMRTGIEGLVAEVQLQSLDGMPLLLFLLLGFVTTSLIQSSSATMALTLSALHAQALSLEPAVAIVLGSEVGTTIKLFLASLKGTPAKKRVALGNFLVNSITVLLVMLFMQPLLRLVTTITGGDNILIALVFFQSTVNFLSILFFYPLLGVLGRYLQTLYQRSQADTLFIHKMQSVESSSALFELEKENRHFLYACLDFVRSSMKLGIPVWPAAKEYRDYSARPDMPKYEFLKLLYGEMHLFYIRLQKNISLKEEVEKAERLMSSVRNTMYAAKNIKDALPDIARLSASSKNTKYEFFTRTRDEMADFCTRLSALMEKGRVAQPEDLIALYKSTIQNYTGTLQNLYKDSLDAEVQEEEITTLLNFNREIYTAYKSFIFGVKDLLFDKEQARYFDELPGFIK